jgi:hypothetical protein
VFFGKESEKASEEKPVEKQSGEKPSDQPQPKPKPKLVRFHCGYCERHGHKDEFCFKRKREERTAKEWDNKDKYHPSSGVLEPRVQMPRAKASVRTVPAWGEQKAAGIADGGVKPVRPVLKLVRQVWGLQGGKFGFRAREESRFVSGGRGSGGWSREFAGGQFARRSPSRAKCGDGRSRSFEMERRDDRWFSFRGFGPPTGREGWFPRSGYLGGVRGGSIDMRDALECANPTFEQMARHWFYSFGTNPVLSRLFTHVLVFEFLVGDLKNIWLIDYDCSTHMTENKGSFSILVPVVTKRYITFGDNGRGRVLSEGEIKVNDKITLRRVAVVQSLGYNFISLSQLLNEGFEVLFRPGGSPILDSRGDLVCMVIPKGQVFRAEFFSVFWC